MMDTLIVIVIVAAALAFIARRAWNSFAASRKPKAGCASCDMANTDSEDWAK